MGRGPQGLCPLSSSLPLVLLSSFRSSSRLTVLDFRRLLGFLVSAARLLEVLLCLVGCGLLWGAFSLLDAS